MDTTAKNNVFPFIIGLLVILASAAFFIVFISRVLPSQPEQSAQTGTDVPPIPDQDSDQHQGRDADELFRFEWPAPSDDLIADHLPYSGSVNDAVFIDEYAWLVTDGGLMQYRLEDGQQISYTDRTIANCIRDILYIEGYLYVNCFVNNEGAFGSTSVDDSLYPLGGSAILKIDPATYTVERRYDTTNGIENDYNFIMHADGEIIWLETFQGVARIDTTDGTIDFYTDELGFPETNERYSVNYILIDTDHVWVSYNANDYSNGGVSMYSKENGSWTAFGIDDLMEYPTRFDLEKQGPSTHYAKTIPGGIQIAFKDGSLGMYDRLVEKQYQYDTGEWTVVAEHVATGPQAVATEQLLQANYPSPPQYSFVDSEGLTQLQNPDGSQEYRINGREAFQVSSLIDGKQYILTGTTLDLLDNSSSFPDIIVNLAGNEFISSSDPNERLFDGSDMVLIGPDEAYALIIDNICVGQCREWGYRVWYVDLKTRSLVTVFDLEDDKLFSGVDPQSHSLYIEKNEAVLSVQSEDGTEFFQVDTTSETLIEE